VEQIMTRGRVRVECGRKRIRAYLSGELAADTTSPLLVWEVPYYPVYYIPAGDIRADLLPTGTTDHAPSRGIEPGAELLVAVPPDLDPGWC
jgi:uncharacterized protein (DUF427 family)